MDREWQMGVVRLDSQLSRSWGFKLACAGMLGDMIGPTHGTFSARARPARMIRYSSSGGGGKAEVRERAIELREGIEVPSLPRPEAMASMVRAVGEHPINTEDAFADFVPAKGEPSQ